MDWGHPIDEICRAIQWADKTAKSSGQDVYLMSDLSISFIENAKEPPLEIIRCIDGKKGNT